jgi:hypothetical protein
MDLALQTMVSFGFKDTELDDIKALIMDTNFYLLMVTISVCFVHVSFLVTKNNFSSRFFSASIKFRFAFSVSVRFFGIQK